MPQPEPPRDRASRLSAAILRVIGKVRGRQRVGGAPVWAWAFVVIAGCASQVKTEVGLWFVR